MIRPVTPADLPAIRDLFARYPYKHTQQKVQKLDRDRLALFYQRQLETALARGARAWLALDRDRPSALAGLALNAWHGEVYGRVMARLQPWLNTETPHAGPPLLAAVRAAARADGIDHLAVRLDGEDFLNLHLFEADGWRLVDLSMKFSRELPPGEPPPPPPPGSFHIGPAAAADHPWIRRLGSTTHGATHFLNDPALPRERTVELFSRWIDRCLAGLAWRVFLLRERPGGPGLGFVIFLRNPALAEAVGRRPLILDFVLLDPAARGRGLGAWFIQETVRRAADEARRAGEPFDFCELRTSAHNLPAVVAYEKAGFLCCATDMVLHGPG